MAQASRQSVALRDEALPNLEVSARLLEQQKRALHAVPAHKPRRRPVTVGRVLCVAMILVLCGTLIYSQMQLTQLTDQISRKESELSDLNSQYVALKTKQEQTLSLNYIEDYAQNVLGMVKMDTSQIEYVEMSSPDLVEVNNAGATVNDAVASLVRSFTAVLEYLR